MTKFLLVGAAGILAGVLIATSGRVDPFIARPRTGDTPPAAVAGDDTRSLESRVEELERALSVEREARQMLEDELFRITRNMPVADAADAPDAQAARSRASERREMRGEIASERRVDRMVQAGIDPARAEWILRRESELQFEDLQQRYEASRNGSIQDFYTSSFDFANRLREELGDTDYERYLRANGRSGNVVVSAVLEASPAQAAGLQPGDRITRYDGQRVFTMYDVTRQIMDGTPGENVVLEFERNGQPMQVVVPRGPVGISGGS